MPCKKCEDGKYKHGETGECKYDTKAECEQALVLKKQQTLEMLTDEDGYLTVAHLELGCTNAYD